jgi:hypothetical protein
MHGSPLSKWDNRDLWKRYDYRDFGIIAEPYFDLDFDEVFYLTDTGRRWDGDRVSVRDKICSEKIRRLEDKKVSKSKAGMKDKVVKKEDEKIRGLEGERLDAKKIRGLEAEKVRTLKQKKDFEELRFRSTFDIILAAEKGLLPDRVMINTHPQRWTDNPVEWTKELVWQNVKNVVKYFYVRTLKR